MAQSVVRIGAAGTAWGGEGWLCSAACVSQKQGGRRKLLGAAADGDGGLKGPGAASLRAAGGGWQEQVLALAWCLGFPICLPVARSSAT